MARRSIGIAGRACSVVFVIVLVMVFFTTFRIAPVQGESLGLQVVRRMEGAACRVSRGSVVGVRRRRVRIFTASSGQAVQQILPHVLRQDRLSKQILPHILPDLGNELQCYAVPVLPDLGNVNGVTPRFMKSANGWWVETSLQTPACLEIFSP